MELNIFSIETKSGFFLSLDPTYAGDPTYKRSPLLDFFINGELPSKTFHNMWVFSKEKPVSIQRKIPGGTKNIRYQLVDPSLESEKIPLTIKESDAICQDDEGDWIWKPELSHLKSLYSRTFDLCDPTLEEVSFTLNEIMRIDAEIKESNGFSMLKEINPKVRTDVFEHDVLAKISMPSLLVNKTRCKINSKDLYEIVRQYIKRFINTRYAIITSDYDFCFQVEKNILLSEPETYEVEEKNSRGKSFSPKRIKKKFINNRKVKVFDMCPSEYQKYTVIQPIEADNEDELAEKIHEFCKKTIELINEPLVECKHCSGMGVVMEKNNEKVV